MASTPQHFPRIKTNSAVGCCQTAPWSAAGRRLVCRTLTPRGGRIGSCGELAMACRMVAGTTSSNPALSCGESVANRFLPRAEPNGKPHLASPSYSRQLVRIDPRWLHPYFCGVGGCRTFGVNGDRFNVRLNVHSDTGMISLSCSEIDLAN